jgi:hypothetical protein
MALHGRRARAWPELQGVILLLALVDRSGSSFQQHQPAPGELRRSLVLATGSSSPSVSPSRWGSIVEEQPAPAPEWRSWRRQQPAGDRSEVKRLREMLSQAEKEVVVLNDRLADAKQAQERANYALRDKDTRLTALTQQLRASSEVLSALAPAPDWRACRRTRGPTIWGMR